MTILCYKETPWLSRSFQPAFSRVRGVVVVRHLPWQKTHRRRFGVFCCLMGLSNIRGDLCFQKKMLVVQFGTPLILGNPAGFISLKSWGNLGATQKDHCHRFFFCMSISAVCRCYTMWYLLIETKETWIARTIKIACMLCFVAGTYCWERASVRPQQVPLRSGIAIFGGARACK